MMIDADGLVAGRLASLVAKNVIKGESVIIINAEKTILVGSQTAVMPKFQQRVDAGVKSNPHYGPKYDRIPSKMLRRMIRGMLPNKSRTVERLLKQVKVYNGTPKNVDTSKLENMDKIKYSMKGDFMYLDDVAKTLGGQW